MRPRKQTYPHIRSKSVYSIFSPFNRENPDSPIQHPANSVLCVIRVIRDSDTYPLPLPHLRRLYLLLSPPHLPIQPASSAPPTASVSATRLRPTCQPNPPLICVICLIRDSDTYHHVNMTAMSAGKRILYFRSNSATLSWSVRNKPTISAPMFLTAVKSALALSHSPKSNQVRPRL